MTVVELPSGTLTFLFTDIEGSTRLLRQLRERYVEVLADHRRLLRAAFDRFGGQEMGTEGDAFFVVFRRASDAVAAAVAAQRALAEHRSPASSVLRVRMGLNTGEPAIDEEGYVGLGVHRAARICAAGHGGQILLSQSTWALVHGEEFPEVGVRDLGEHILKDFDRPERIFQLIAEGLLEEFPPLKTVDAQSTEDPFAPVDPALPYKGLEAFQAKDAEFFFGREELIGRLCARLGRSSFVAAVGPSGSGKSSVVQAGVIPAIWEGAVGNGASSDWKVVIMAPGARPLEELALRLASVRGMPAGFLLDELRADAHHVSLAVRQLLLDRLPETRFVLAVDQLEEVFALCRDEFERRRFIDALVHLVSNDSRATVVVALRADFYGECAAYPALAALLQDNQEIVGPMGEAELRRAIEGPAARAGLELERGLVETILSDLGAEPGNLPLLSHGLLETWKRREGRKLTLAAYRDAGGVREAIARTADTVFREQLDPAEREVARHIFLRLTELGDVRETRRRATLDELLSLRNAELVLETLARARLITVGQGTAEVAHEALIREWPTLRRWLDEDREGLQLHRRLTTAAQEWVALGRDPGVLYRRARLAAAQAWAAEHARNINPLEREFLEASSAAELSELEAARRQGRRLRVLALSLTVLLIAATVLAFVAARESRRAGREADISTSRLLAGEAIARLENQPDLGFLLALEAYGIRPTIEARSAAIEAAQRSQRMIAIVRQLEPVSPSIHQIIFSPQGDIFAARRERDIAIWSVARRDRVTTLDARSLGGIAFSPDGKLLAVPDHSSIRLWNLASSQPSYKLLDIKTDTVLDVAFSPDGKLLAAGIRDGSISIWDVERRRRMATVPGDPRKPSGDMRSPVLEVEFSPDQRWLASGQADGTIVQRRVAMWDAIAARWRLPDDSVSELAFRPAGKGLVAVTRQGSLWLWDPAEREPPARPEDARAAVRSVAFSPDGRMLAIGDSLGGLRLVDARDLSSVRTRLAEGGRQISSVAFSPQGDMVASGNDRGTVILWDAGRGESLTMPDGSDRVRRAAFSPDRRAAAVVRNETISIWDIVNRKRLGEGLRTPGALDVAFSPDGRMFAAGGRDGTIELRRIGDQVPRWTIRAYGGFVTRVLFSPDGMILASAGDDVGRLPVKLWNVANGTLSGPPLDHERGFPTSIAFSSDGRTLASGDASGVIVLWDLENRVALGDPLVGHTGNVEGLAFSPDGKTLASVSTDSSLRLWDVVKRAPLGQPLENAGGFRVSVEFTPDGETLASSGGGVDAEIRLWDVATRRLLGSPLRASDEILAVAFEPGEEHLLAVTANATLLSWERGLWAKRLEDFETRLCGIVGRNLTRQEWAEFVPERPYRRTCSR